MIKHLIQSKEAAVYNDREGVKVVFNLVLPKDITSDGSKPVEDFEIFVYSESKNEGMGYFIDPVSLRSLGGHCINSGSGGSMIPTRDVLRDLLMAVVNEVRASEPIGGAE